MNICMHSADAALCIVCTEINPLKDRIEELEIDIEEYETATSKAQFDAVKAEAQLEKSQWQPIETAPKDGSLFLGVMDDGWQFVALWDRGNKRFITDDARNFAYPTHWMPLPEPPQ